MQEKKKRYVSLATRQKNYIFGTTAALLPVHASDFCTIGNMVVTLTPVIDYLKYFSEYEKDEAEFSPGIIFYGEPGTGKTYAARFVATETEAHTVDVREFPCDPDGEDTLSRKDVHRMFELAREFYSKKRKPIILFWDQFDAFLEACSQEARNQLYVELDGAYGKNTGVFIIASTVLDPYDPENEETFGEQLLRKGRLGIQVMFTRPTRKQQAELLAHAISKKPHGPIDVEALACLLVDPTPAAIVDVVRVGWTRACREKRLGRSGPTMLTEDDLLNVLIDNLQGHSLASDMTAERKMAIAIHELGHALVARQLGRPVQMISIIPAADSLGKTYCYLPWDHQENEEDLRNSLAISVASLAVEELFGISTGLARESDIRGLTDAAKNFISGTGSGKKLRDSYGPMAVSESPMIPISEKLKETFEGDLTKLINDEHGRARSILEAIGKERIRYMAEAFCRKDPPILLQAEFDALREESKRVCHTPATPDA